MKEAMEDNRLPNEMSIARRKRINRLKKMILVSIAVAILIPIVVCIILAIQLGKVSKELQMLKEQYAIINTNVEENQDVPIDYDAIDTSDDSEINTQEDIEAEENGKRKVYLTFDDGPSIYTDEILDILAQYDVKATFFVVGEKEEKYDPMYERIVLEGHSIGMHSYSHKYTEIYKSLDSFKKDVEDIRNLIKEKAGVECSLYRFPGGSSNSIGKDNIEEYIAYLNEENIVYYDWNISSKDATGVSLSVEEIVANSTLGLENYDNAVILFHDSSDKYTTVQALPQIIETILAMDNTEIVPITEGSVPVQHIENEQLNGNGGV